MINYISKIIKELVLLLMIGVFGILNWQFPLFLWFDDTPVIRFVWLGIFFVLLDIVFEIIAKIVKQFRLIAENMSLGRDIKKISDGFKVVTNFSLPNNLKADFVVIGSSGLWLVMIKDDKGRVEFNGDEIIQDGVVLKGLLTKTLEKAYSLAGIIKQKLNRDIIVTPVVGFSSSGANLSSVPKIVHGVRLISRNDAVALIENTDVQLLDKNTIEEIYKILKSGLK